jgi:ABC-type multidrug transport system fused ATPase/permease subunit
MLIRLLRGYLLPYRRQVAIVTALLLLQSIANLYLPNLNADIINNGVAKGDTDASNVSAGQRQLVTIARAFLAAPSILVLDEATSNVDRRTEVLIQQAMARQHHGRTTFVIAHRLSTIRNADEIVVIDKGRIVEQGDHAELLRREGFYYDLYQSQFAETVGVDVPGRAKLPILQPAG